MAKDSVIEQLFDSLRPAERQNVLREAGRGERAGLDIFEKPDPREVKLLVPPLLRRIHVPNEMFKLVAREAHISLAAEVPIKELQIVVPFMTSDNAGHTGIPITELAAASLVFWELSLRVASVFSALEISESLEPPEVEVKLGSTNFTVGGGPLLVSGVGFIIAAHTAFQPGPGADVAFYGGSILAVLGLIDLIIGWQKTIVEIQKTKGETMLNELKARLTELEIQTAERTLAPASALIPQAIVVDQARRFRLDPALGLHLINEVMPAFHGLTTNRGPITVSTESGGKASASAV